MSYLVLARKYRPQRFDDLVGQEHVARTLANAFALGRLHHAFLFTGSRGVGKTSAARILAMALCCEQGPTAQPCGVCEPCREIAAGRSVDVVEIDGASNNGVEDVRSLRETVRYAPARGRSKVTIIDEVHMLSSSAWNALLKTLEEPPAHAVFILATTEVHRIPPTILSRVQRYDFKLIPTARLVEHLGKILEGESIPFETAALRLVARQATGSARDALSLLDQVIAFVGTETVTAEKVAAVLGLADRRVLAEMLGAVLDKAPAGALRAFAAASDRGVDLTHLARSFLTYIHDVELLGVLGDDAESELGSADEVAEARALLARAPRGALGALFDRWGRAVEEAAKSQSPRLVLDMALVDLCFTDPLLPLGDLLQRLEELELRWGTGAGPAPPRPPSRPAPAPTPARAAPVAPPPPVPAPAPPARGTTTPAEAGSGEPRLAPPSPAPPVAPAPRVPTPDAAAAPIAGRLNDAWSRVQGRFRDRMSLAAALDHAHVLEAAPGEVHLVFPDRFTLEQTEKSRLDVERAFAEAFGGPVRLLLKQGAVPVGTAASASTVAREADARESERKRREAEARAHPMVRKAQDLFGVGLREVKT